MALNMKDDTFSENNFSSYDNNDDQENINDNINENDNLASEAVTEYSLESENSNFEINNDKTSQQLNYLDNEVENNFYENNNNENDINDDEENEEGNSETIDEKRSNEQENSENSNNNNNNVRNKSENKNKVNKNEETDKIYNCEWDECHNKYEDFDKFIEHLNKEHIDNITKSTEFGCLWRTCERKNKPNGCKAALRNHVRKHTGEKPYECENCHKKFARSDALGKHKKKCSIDPKFFKRKRDENNDISHSSKKRANNTNNKYLLISDHNELSISSSKKNNKNQNSLNKNDIIKEEHKNSNHNKSHHNKSKNIISINIKNSSSSSKAYKELYRELKAKYRHSLQENIILEEEYQRNFRQLSRLKLERNTILDNLIKYYSV